VLGHETWACTRKIRICMEKEKVSTTKFPRAPQGLGTRTCKFMARVFFGSKQGRGGGV